MNTTNLKRHTNLPQICNKNLKTSGKHSERNIEIDDQMERVESISEYNSKCAGKKIIKKSPYHINYSKDLCLLLIQK